MEIILKDIGKRYLYEWIFKKINVHFQPQHRYAILGNNGSGKSTFLKIIAGHLSPSKGTIEHHYGKQAIDKEKLYQQISFAAPYIDLIEEFTLLEAIRFHQRFKNFRKNLTPDEFLQLIQLSDAKNKEIRFFSSGMKQRLKLGLAICSDTSLLLLDEPTSNLDEASIAWYQAFLNQFTDNRLVIIASNEKRDIEHCTKRLNIMEFKGKK